jgi:hypothetical protein
MKKSALVLLWTMFPMSLWGVEVDTLWSVDTGG